MEKRKKVVILWKPKSFGGSGWWKYIWIDTLVIEQQTPTRTSRDKREILPFIVKEIEFLSGPAGSLYICTSTELYKENFSLEMCSVFGRRTKQAGAYVLINKWKKKKGMKNIGCWIGQRKKRKFRFHHPSKAALPATNAKGYEPVVSGVYVSAAAIGLFTFVGDQRK